MPPIIASAHVAGYVVPKRAEHCEHLKGVNRPSKLHARSSLAPRKFQTY